MADANYPDREGQGLALFLRRAFSWGNPAATADGVVLLNPDTGNPSAPRATYSVSAAGYGAYATPTDLIGIRGSATKIIKVLNFRLAIRSTAAALQNVDILRRSVANTGGTTVAPTAVPFDSTNPPATAVVDVYTAAPVLGASAGVLAHRKALSTTLTSALTYMELGMANVFPQNSIGIGQPVVLRGVNEALYFNYAGAALTAGFEATYEIVWTEE